MSIEALCVLCQSTNIVYGRMTGTFRTLVSQNYSSYLPTLLEPQQAEVLLLQIEMYYSSHLSTTLYITQESGHCFLM